MVGVIPLNLVWVLEVVLWVSGSMSSRAPCWDHFPCGVGVVDVSPRVSGDTSMGPRVGIIPQLGWGALM